MDRILIIHDSPSVKAMLKFRLESGGFSVETVETGEEGIEKTKKRQYQLIHRRRGINRDTLNRGDKSR